MDGSLYYEAPLHRDRIDPEEEEVVMPRASLKTGKAKQRINKASAETSKI